MIMQNTKHETQNTKHETRNTKPKIINQFFANNLPFFFQYNIIITPKSIPPKCAKCAMLSPAKLATPKNNSKTPYPITKYLALIGMGGKSNIRRVSGNSQPNAKRMPNTDPEAPTVIGMLSCEILCAIICIVLSGDDAIAAFIEFIKG